ncbi:DUF4349 domain-containing protein [Streptomyces meridianus]|uniref:DUF4349 domain-containing protein n=1 Tax=Streptomyces meridianus TaxID=2938945 RepID=A0ABT0X5K9_9ACTN|nr:DUF4349 domain-containing protein [Streptomyces meridianus]MCM2576947.1 DUF4349 domain-containing protein [Streptomyces meridianus]
MSNRSSGARWRPAAALAATVLVLALGTTGCGAPDASADKSAVGQDRAESAQRGGNAAGGDAKQRAGEPAVAKAPKPVVAHIIRTASLTVRVKSVPEAAEDARTAAEKAGGYVGDETTDRDRDGHERSRMVLRVPQDSYEQTLGDLAGSGTVLRRKVDAKDVTDRVVDVESRIRSQKASVERVRKLMGRATELEDVVLLEGELNSRQADLEALQAQQASLKERTGMATVTLLLSETAVAQDDGEPTFLDALAGGWQAFLTTVRWVAIVLGAILPFAAAGGVLYALWRVVRDRLPRRPTRGRTGGGHGGFPPAVPGPAAHGEGRAADEEPAQR